jgi:hypothetical protein
VECAQEFKILGLEISFDFLNLLVFGSHLVKTTCNKSVNKADLVYKSHCGHFCSMRLFPRRFLGEQYSMDSCS